MILIVTVWRTISALNVSGNGLPHISVGVDWAGSFWGSWEEPRGRRLRFPIASTSTSWGMPISQLYQDWKLSKYLQVGFESPTYWKYLTSVFSFFSMISTAGLPASTMPPQPPYPLRGVWGWRVLYRWTFFLCDDLVIWVEDRYIGWFLVDV